MDEFLDTPDVDTRARALVPSAPNPVRVALYTRPGCHLCDDMKVILVRIGKICPFEMQEIDISTDRTLERRFGRDIPVLFVDGAEVARHRIDDGALLNALRRGRTAQDACAGQQPARTRS